MKVRASVKPICEKCKVIKRKGKVNNGKKKTNKNWNYNIIKIF